MRISILCGIVVGAMGLMGFGLWEGWRMGRQAELENWQQTLARWGCAGYIQDTGEWCVINGTKCVPEMEQR